MSMSSAESSPLRICSGSDGEPDTRSPVSSCGETSERPERMRDWLIRMINSGRFSGLQWLDKDKTVFKVPWIHAKKRGYCRERDAALFREWALHSGKYRVDSDPTVWKINFRCAINGLKDIMEIKDMQTEDCRVYKVLPSRSKRRRRPRRHEPYPSVSYATSDASLAPHLFTYHGGLPPYPVGITTAAATDSMYTPPYTPAIKMEYPPPCSQSIMTSCMQQLPPASSPSFSYPCSSTSTGIHIPEPIISPGSYSPNVSSSNGHLNEASFFGDHLPSPQLPPVSTIHHSMQPHSTKTDIIPIRRQDSPDSGIGNVEPQNSPLMSQQHSPSPLVVTQQNSPLMSQQHSPLMAQQNSPLMSQQGSPLMVQQASPLSTEPQENYSMNLHSPTFSANSPASAVTSDDNKVVEIIGDLEVNPPTPPLSATPPSGELQLRILYGSIAVHTENFDCSKGCKVLSTGGSMMTPWMDDTENRLDMHKITLPENHPQQASHEIFHAMRQGLIVEASEGNIYVTPLCRTVVYCASSPTEQPQPLERGKKTKVFDYNNYFRPALEKYALFHGQSPTPNVILGLGQAWGASRHVAQNLISVVITHSKAKHEMDMICLPDALTQDLLLDLPESLDVKEPNVLDLEAEAFLKQIEAAAN